jgi:chromosome segregation ATPase
MNVSNDTPSMNYVEYFTKQLPVDLASMAALRDELAVRQGALSAAQDAVTDRATAAAELTAARSQAADLVAIAKDREEKSKAKAAELTARESAVTDSIKAFDAASAERGTALGLREKASDTREARQQRIQADLDAKAAQLSADQAALDARVQAFQDKVAALKA